MRSARRRIPKKLLADQARLDIKKVKAKLEEWIDRNRRGRYRHFNQSCVRASTSERGRRAAMIAEWQHPLRAGTPAAFPCAFQAERPPSAGKRHTSQKCMQTHRFF